MPAGAGRGVAHVRRAARAWPHAPAAAGHPHAPPGGAARTAGGRCAPRDPLHPSLLPAHPPERVRHRLQHAPPPLHGAEGQGYKPIFCKINNLQI